MTLRSRFGKELDKLARDYTASVPFDQRLYREDIAGSIPHARMMAKQGIISDKDAELICMGLISIRDVVRAHVKKLRAQVHFLSEYIP